MVALAAAGGVGLPAGCVAAPRAQATEAGVSLLDPRFAGTSMAHGGAPRTGVGVTESFGIRLAAGGDGVVRENGRVRAADALAVARGDGAIFVEAESAEQVNARSGATAPEVKEDASCAGGRYVDNPDFIAAAFRVERDGQREVWLRVRTASDVKHLCFWGLDASRRLLTLSPTDGAGRDGEGEAARGWRWIKAGALGVGSGEHRFAAQRFHRADFRLDRIALLPAGDAPPEGEGPAAATLRVDAGTVETRDLTPPGLSALVAISAKGDLNGGSMDFAVSLDGGASWREAPGGRLAGVTLKGDGSDTLRFRVTLRRGPDGRSPELRGLALTVRPGPGRWLAVRNDFVRILADRVTGRLFRVTDLARDREVLWPDKPFSLFSVDLKKRGAVRWLRYSDETTSWVSLVKDKRGRTSDALVKAEGLEPGMADDVAGADAAPAAFVGAAETDGAVVLDFAVQKRVALRLRLQLDETGQGLWSVRVRNDHPELDVIRLQFPTFEAIRLGVNGMDDCELRMRQFGHNKERPGLGPLRASTYPGMALPWESIYDDEGGFGVIVRDRGAAHVTFSGAAEAPFGDVFSLDLGKRDNVPAGGGEREWEYAVAVHPGGWHWVADRYREWAVGHFDRPRYPAWFSSSDGYYFYAIMNTGLPFRDLGRLALQARRLGLRHVQIWGQFTDFRKNCCGPYWAPSPRYGSIAEFKQGIADIHAEGCKVGFYFLHDRVDLYHAEGSHMYGFIAKSEYPPGTEFPTPEFLDKVQLVTNPDGATRAYPLSGTAWDEYAEKVRAHQEDPLRNRPPQKWQPVDLSDPDWWEYMRHWAIDKYVEEWGADGLYYDVLGCGSARESFDLRKGRHGHGLAGVGKAGIARTTVQSARARGHQDFFLLQEGLNDLPGQYTAGLNASLYRNRTEVVRYTWPDFAVFDDHAGQGARNLRRVVDYGFLNGNRLGIRVVNHIMADIVATRARVRDWLQRGRFMDTLGLDSPVPARLFLRRDASARGATVTFLNRDGAAGTARLDARRVGEVKCAIGVDCRGETFAVPLTREGDEIAFPVPAARLAAVVLAEQADVDHGLVAGVRLLRAGDEWRIEAAVGNLTGETVSGAIALRAPGPFKAPAAPPAFTCTPGSVVRVRVPVAAARGAGKFVRLGVDVIAGGRKVAAAGCSSFPLFEDPSFEAEGNDERASYEGARSLRLDPAAGTFFRRFPLYVDPSRRYRMSLMYKRTPGKDGGSFARAFETQPNGKLRPLGTLRFTKDGEWARAQAEFVVSADAVGAALYIYNNRSDRTVRIDAVRVEELGEADRED